MTFQRGAPAASLPAQPEPSDCVLDALWEGRFPVWQPARRCGYRFNLDPILLAHFLPPTEHLVDLGAGVGIVGLLALALNRAGKVTAIERQPSLARLLRRNLELHGALSRTRLIEGDLREVTCPEDATLVAFNPPYFTARQGRPCRDAGRDAGRREVHGTLADFVRVAAQATKRTRGAVASILPWCRKEEIERLYWKAGLFLARSRPICARRGDQPGHLLTLAQHEEVRVQHQPQLIVHADTTTGYAGEVGSWLRGPEGDP